MMLMHGKVIRLESRSMYSDHKARIVIQFKEADVTMCMVKIPNDCGMKVDDEVVFGLKVITIPPDDPDGHTEHYSGLPLDEDHCDVLAATLPTKGVSK
jgi:hypothetical protein